jgi:hypothetical protein
VSLVKKLVKVLSVKIAAIRGKDIRTKGNVIKSKERIFGFP